MKRLHRRTLVATMVAAGCATHTPSVVQPGAPGGESRTVAATARPPVKRAVVAADVEFMQRMIMHHAQALEMTRLLTSHTKNPAMQLMARRIDVSQTDEIALMKAWLAARGQPAAMAHDGHTMNGMSGMSGMVMPGMLSNADMERLDAARDAAFDRIFLESMIRHHEGALDMVKTLLATDGAGQDPEIYSFITHVDADQRAEIARMRNMLKGSPQKGMQ